MDIPGFFEFKSVFVTGGTGFIGKVLVEKLLRSCPGLKKIYFLARCRNSLTAIERVDELKFKSDLFQRVREENPGILSKLVILEGDVTLPALGLTEQDQATVLQDVSVIFHLASTVKFNETLRCASNVNVIGTKNITEFAKKMTNLKAFVYVSTSYSNCNRRHIDEIIYPSTVRSSNFLDIFQQNSDEELERMTPELIKGHPNTYTFTKLVAENYLADHCRDLPVIIARPPVVTAAWKEPLPGWIDTMSGVNAVLIAMGMGALQIFLINSDRLAEMLPVDIAVNQIIAGAWKVGTFGRDDKSEIHILQGVSSSSNCVPLRELFRIYFNVLRSYPFKNTVRRPACTFTANKATFRVLYILHHYVPASMADLWLRMKGQEARFTTKCRRLFGALEVFHRFATCNLYFISENVQILQDQLSPEDKETFKLTIKDIDWAQYAKDYSFGLRRWILKELPPEPFKSEPQGQDNEAMQ